MAYDSPIWELSAEWDDGDALRYNHTFFSTKRDAEAVGRRLAVAHGSENHGFTYYVEQVKPWSSSTRSVPFQSSPTIDLMVTTTEKEWGL